MDEDPNPVPNIEFKLFGPDIEPDGIGYLRNKKTLDRGPSDEGVGKKEQGEKEEAENQG